MSGAIRRLGRHANRLLRALFIEGNTATIEGDLVILRARDGGTLSGKHAKSAADSLLTEGLAMLVVGDPGAAKQLRLSETGERLAQRRLAASADAPEFVNAFRARQGNVQQRRILDEAGLRTVSVDEAESPLLWLCRRKGRNGEPMISDAAFAAGERLRADYTKSMMAPRMGADWSNPMAGAASRSTHGLNATESMIAARQRLNAALSDVGPEFSGLLLDLCCFLKGLEQIERERRWPVRSAKVVVELALQRLARHYGYEEEARGGERSRMRSWGSAGYRPAFPSEPH